MSVAGGPDMIQDGLVLSLNAADRNSYPGSGTVWTDLSGNGNNGTLTNGPTFSSANGGYINYDATDDYTDFGDIFNFTTQDFTFNHWFYCNTLTTNRAGQGPVILYKGSYATNGYYTQVDISGTLILATNQINTFQITSTAASTISPGIWYNAAFTRSGSSVRIYVNGVDSTSVAGTHQNPTSTTNSFRIANYQNGFIYANIRVASFLTYNRALSASEVAQNYNSTKTRFGL